MLIKAGGLSGLLLSILLQSSFHINFAWDPNTESDIGGYILYWGQSSRSYTSSVRCGNVTTYTLEDIVAGTWYFAVTAYNTAGAESGYSNEVVAMVPIVPETPSGFIIVGGTNEIQSGGIGMLVFPVVFTGSGADSKD